MSLNDIQLTPQLLERLYSRSLIGEADNGADISLISPPSATPARLPTENPVPEKPAPTGNTIDFRSLGNNQKNVLVGVHYSDIVNLPDAQLDFLTTLLKACKLGLTDVAVINFNNYADVEGSEIMDYFKSRVVMLFGITPKEFGFPFEIPEYQVQQFAGRTVIHSPALHGIQDNKAEKGKLWAGLKRIFNV